LRRPEALARITRAIKSPTRIRVYRSYKRFASLPSIAPCPFVSARASGSHSKYS